MTRAGSPCRVYKARVQPKVSRVIGDAKREELLDSAGVIWARLGVLSASLREVAAAMGTSGRMVFHYFGAREQFFDEVLKRQQHESLQQTREQALSESVEEHRKWCFDNWRTSTSGHRSNNLRFMLQVYGAACATESPYREFAWETMSLLRQDWQQRLEALGMPSDIAETRSRIALATFCGLGIEAFSAWDGDAADEGFERFIDEYLLSSWY